MAEMILEDETMSQAAGFFMVCGYITTVGLLASHALKAEKVRKERQIGDAAVYPFYFVLVNCSFWAVYGMVDLDLKVGVLNIIGIVAMVYSIAVFMCVDEANRRTQGISLFVAFAVAIIPALWIIFSIKKTTTDPDAKKTTADAKVALGVGGCFAAVFMYFVSMVADVSTWRIQQQQGQQVPQNCGEWWEKIQVLLASVMNTIFWIIFGKLNRDKYVLIGNSIGLAFCVFQLAALAFISCDVVQRCQGVNWAAHRASIRNFFRRITGTAHE